jgi:hypothetical protein
VADLARNNPDLIVFDPTSYLCDTTDGICSIAKDGKFLYSYSDHVSDYGSSLVASHMLPLLDKDLSR